MILDALSVVGAVVSMALIISGALRLIYLMWTGN